MPVCSYVVYPREGAVSAVQQQLESLPGCEVRVSDDCRLLVLVTDTPDLQAEAELQANLKTVAGISHLALSFGYTEPDHLDKMAAKGLPKVAK